jgi:hypothetical protein
MVFKANLAKALSIVVCQNLPEADLPEVNICALVFIIY